MCEGNGKHCSASPRCAVQVWRGLGKVIKAISQVWNWRRNSIQLSGFSGFAVSLLSSLVGWSFVKDGQASKGCTEQNLQVSAVFRTYCLLYGLLIPILLQGGGDDGKGRVEKWRLIFLPMGSSWASTLEREVWHWLWKQDQTQKVGSSQPLLLQASASLCPNTPKALLAWRSQFLSPDHSLLGKSPRNRAAQRQQRHQINHSSPASPPSPNG